MNLPTGNIWAFVNEITDKIKIPMTKALKMKNEKEELVVVEAIFIIVISFVFKIEKPYFHSTLNLKVTSRAFI